MNCVRKCFVKNISQRCLIHTASVFRSNLKPHEQARVPEEIRIPVPWGHIAGKLWGGRNPSLCVAIHGLLDNANSYDKLMNYLNYPSVFCLDLPGHGMSSHIPKGMSINYVDYVIFLRYIIKNYFKMEKVSLLGHSYGSSLCFAYAGIYPNEVCHMVNIDCSRLATAAYTERTVSDLRNSVVGFLESEQNSKLSASGYSWDNTVRHLYDLRVRLGMPLSLEGCEMIAKRGISKINDMEYRFSFDERLKQRSLGRFTRSMNLAFAKRIICPVLNIQPKEGLLAIENFPISSEEMKEHLKELEKHSSLFVHVNVEGFHHAHIDHPKSVAEAINSFISCIQSKSIT